MQTIFAIVLFALSWLAISPAHGQALEPCQAESQDDYASGVDKIIDSAVGRQSQLSLTTIPSFEPESGVRLVGNDVYFVQLKASFWAHSYVMEAPGRAHQDFSSPHAETTVSRASLSPGIAIRIRQLFASAISRAKKTDEMGLDGVTFRFALPGVGCGETWSPEPQTRNGRLVKLAQLLSAHAQLSKPRSMQRSEERILQLLSSIGSR